MIAIRTVRSYVRREGRITASQRRAIERLWGRYGVDGELPCDPVALFGRSAPLILEIGFGAGESLLSMARDHSENNYLGIEVYRPGVGRLLKAVDEAGLTNIRIIHDDAFEALKRVIPQSSLDAVLLLFPDPWPKKRHHKRRLVQPEFIALLASRLKPGGLLHMATDWEDYAEQMMTVMTQSRDFENLAGPGRYSKRPPWRETTRFERRGVRLGHEVRDLLFEKRGGSAPFSS